MAKGRITTKKILDSKAPPEGSFGVFAVDDGTLQVIVEHEGIQHTVTFSPEEWDQVALAGVKLGVVARSAAESQNKVLVPEIKIAPEVARHFGRNGH
jgi:hypothetical protein